MTKPTTRIDLLDAITDRAVSDAQETAQRYRSSASSFHRSLVSVIFMMAVSQSRNRHKTPSLINRGSRASFREFLTRYAYSGEAVWVGTEEEIRSFSTIVSPRARMLAASRYVSHRKRKLRMRDWIARLQPLSSRVVLDINTNHKSIIEDISQIKSVNRDESLRELILYKFTFFINNTYGDSGEKIYNKFYKPKKKIKKSNLDLAIRLLCTLDDEELDRLSSECKLEVARRIVTKDRTRGSRGI